MASTCLLLGGSATAQDEPATTGEAAEVAQRVSWGAESDYNSRYVWRGLAFSQGAVTQPSVWMTAGGATFSVWANRSMDTADGDQLDEVDYSLSWEGAWHKASLEPTLQVWTYPNQQDCPSTAVADLRISWPVGALSVFTTQSLDLIEYRGAYFGEVGLCWGAEVGKRAEAESSVSLGWGSAKFNETYIGPRTSALNVASFELALTYHTRQGVYIRPHLTASRLLNRQLRDAVADPSITSIGLAVGTEF